MVGKKKGGMLQPNPNATPMTNYDLANGYSTLQNGGKSKSKSKRGRKSTKGGTMELNPSESPLVNADLAHGFSTLTGGKSKRGRKPKKGGADPNLGGNSAFYNMDNLIPTASPTTLAGDPVIAASAVTPFSAGMPNYASVEYGLPPSMTNSLTGGLDQPVPTIGGGRKSKGRKTKKGGEIIDQLREIMERLKSNKSEEESKLSGGKSKSKRTKKNKKGGAGEACAGSGDGAGGAAGVAGAAGATEPLSSLSSYSSSASPLLGGKAKRGRKSKNGGGDTLAKLLTIQNSQNSQSAGNGEFSGANDWQTQLTLDNNSNMPGGGKSKRKNKK